MNKFATAIALGLFACAAHAQSDTTATAVPAQAESSETTVITPDPAAAAAMDTGCVRETGTRTRHRDEKGCTGAAGQSYSREEIDRTGASDTGDAIRRLSPAATVRRGG